MLRHGAILHGLTPVRNRTRPFARRVSKTVQRSVRMRRALLTTLVSATVLTSFGAWPADSATILHRAVGLDPKDRGGTCCPEQWDIDIRSSHRTVILDRQDRPRLIVSFRSWEPQPGQTFWGVRAHLDTRGGPRSDASMTLTDDGLGQQHCSFRFRDGPIREGAMSTPTDHPIDRASCRVPRSWAHPDKSIRWWLRVLLRPKKGDRAPDAGWYP
jgi:hypothetical protein